VSVFKIAKLVIGKDLRIEWRARVLVNQILPFALVVVVLFAFGFDTQSQILSLVTPGLFWVTGFFTLQLGVQRAVTIESENQTQDGLLVMGVDSKGIFIGKVGSLVLEAIALEVVLALAVAVLFNSPLHNLDLLAGSALLADIGIAAVGLMLATIARGSKASESLLPLLLFPVVSPVLLAATKVWEYGEINRLASAIPWLELLVAFSLIYLIVGILFYGVILEG
jgi:heme exporter protein B